MPIPNRRKAKRAARARRRYQQLPHVAHDERLSYRYAEFAALIGISLPTLWRRVRDKQIRVVSIGGPKVIPRSEAVRLGLIQP